jgi:hypothetical protein
MSRGTGLRLAIIAVVGFSLQAASLAVTCPDHWAFSRVPQRPQSISPQGPDHASHGHSDGSPHTHEHCSLQGMPGALALLSLDCLCDLSRVLVLMSVGPSAPAPLRDDPSHERISLKFPSRPPIL